MKKYAQKAGIIVIVAVFVASCGILREARTPDTEVDIAAQSIPPQCAPVSEAAKPAVWAGAKELFNGLGNDPHFKAVGPEEVRMLLGKCLAVSKDPWVRARQKDITVAVTTPGAAQLFPNNCDKEVLKAYQDGVDALVVFTGTWLNRKKAEDVKVVWNRTRDSHKLLCRLSGQVQAEGFDSPFDGSDPRAE